MKTPAPPGNRIPFALVRKGLLMEPEPGNPLEAEGVLNPATARASDGSIYVYPRLVARGNVSRIGRARLLVEGGQPVGVERDGVALEPSRGWEHGHHHGGVEDPRITFIAELGVHVMTYVAFGPIGPRPALALSQDGRDWRRLGPILFDYDDSLDTDLNLFPNKDVVFFPDLVPGPHGRPSYAVLHRPMWDDLSYLRPDEPPPLPAGLADPRPGIWISYVDADCVARDLTALTHLRDHRLVASPEQPWESLKIGAGPAPLRVPEGWLLIYHGVEGQLDGGSFVAQNKVRYVAAAMLLDPDDPARVIARSASPLLEPVSPDEVVGTVGNVVFPTAIEEIGGRRYVFYGMADSKIGVALLVGRGEGG